MNETGGEGKPLFPTAGELTGQLFSSLLQPELRDAFAHGRAAVFDAVHAGNEIEILLD
jgi:hypothetical protein